MSPDHRASSSPRRAARPSPLAWAGILALVGAAGLLGLGVFSLFQAARSAEETARLEAGRTASVTARALRGALADRQVLDLLGSGVRFSVEDGRVVVPPVVGWLDDPVEPRLPESLRSGPRKEIDAARRAEFSEGDRAGALKRLAKLSRDETLPAPHRAWILLAAASCAQRAVEAGEAAPRDALLGALIAAVESSGERPRDDVICGVLILCSKVERPLPEWFAPVFARVRPDVAWNALERAAGFDGFKFGRAPKELGAALADVTARRERLRRARELLPSLRGAVAEARAVRKDVLFYFRRAAGSGEGALIDAASLARIIDRERARSTGRLATVGAASLLLHGEALADHPEVVPVIPALLGIAPTEPAPGGVGPQWPLIVTVSALAVFLLLGLGAALRAMRKEQLHTRARADFLTAVTHELKTPLASIRLLVDVLSDRRASPEKRATYLDRLAGEAARLTMLVENVLDLGRLERSERGYDRRREDLREIVQAAALLYRPLASREDMELIVEQKRGEQKRGEQKRGEQKRGEQKRGEQKRGEAEPATGDETPESGASWWARVDRGAITQILLNLFENARRYASDGGIIEVTAARAGRSFRLLVRDRGSGIPETEREAIFERFRRGGSTPDAANPGVGLGLFLSRVIARDHGGDLRCVAPPDGPGAAFELTLPLEEGTLEHGPPEEVPPEDGALPEEPSEAGRIDRRRADELSGTRSTETGSP